MGARRVRGVRCAGVLSRPAVASNCPARLFGGHAVCLPACAHGCRYAAYKDRVAAIDRAHACLSSFTLPNAVWLAKGFPVTSEPNQAKRSAADVLAMPHVDLPAVRAAIESVGGVCDVHPTAAENVEVSLKYKGYLDRQVRGAHTRIRTHSVHRTLALRPTSSGGDASWLVCCLSAGPRD